MNTWIYIVVGVLGLMVVAGYPLQHWLLRRHYEGVFFRGTRHLAEQVATLQVEVERAREVGFEADAKTRRYFDQIEAFEKQRTEWQERYFNQAIGHGNAQNLMMGCIERLSRDLQAKGGRPQIPKVLHAVREEFLQTHELPAREGLALLNPKQAISQAGDQVRAELPDAIKAT